MRHCKTNYSRLKAFPVVGESLAMQQSTPPARNAINKALFRETQLNKFAVAVTQVLTASTLLATTVSVSAQTYPDKPIRVLVPNAPGGGATNIARLFGDRLGQNWGVPVIVDNRAGGNGFIGGSALARSPADGYTIMVMSSTHIITPLLYPAPYDALKDFSPLASVGTTELVMVLHPSVPANTLQEFITLAKSKPGQMNYGSAGSGSINRIAGALFDMTTGTKMQHISYKGSGPLMTDILGGQIQLTFNVPSVTVQHVVAGKLRAIAVSGDARLASLPQVPTFDEVGVKDFDVSVRYGFLAPAGTPKAIVDRLSNEFGKILTMPDIRATLAKQGIEPRFTPSDRFAEQLRSDTAVYARVIKTAGIKADQ